MLYSRKGDSGDTSIFGCDQRFSKSSVIAEALGTLDEVNSFLGVCKVKSEVLGISTKKYNLTSILNGIQQNLFIVQAEVAGADKSIKESKVKDIESIVDSIEKELFPVKSFFVSGGTELTALIDFVRTLARRTERRVVAVSEEGIVKINKNTLAYLNRLSSLLYALARLVNLKSGVAEQSPTYE